MKVKKIFCLKCVRYNGVILLLTVGFFTLWGKSAISAGASVDAVNAVDAAAGGETSFLKNVEVSGETNRVWRNKDGKEIRARLLSIIDDKVKIVSEMSGRKYLYEIEKLSDADLAYLREIVAKSKKQSTEKKNSSSKEVRWSDNYNVSLQEAKKENKILMLYFTGSDWCPPCKILRKNVFQKKKFISYANEELSTVYLDFPARKKLSARVKKQNEKLSQKHKIRAFPTLLFIDTEKMKPLLRIEGYNPSMNAQSLISKINEKRQTLSN